MNVFDISPRNRFSEKLNKYFNEIAFVTLLQYGLFQYKLVIF
jgi:hypothetical protein